ncbi:MAG: PaaI family thioesterase [Bacteroidetes bacterium]|nr:PaaI family thioesterase [Bacteroidota bacterium]
MITIESPINEINAINRNSLMEQLGIEYLELGEGYVKARMPVDHRTKQPMGILHGGASLAFSETMAGLGSLVLVDPEKFEIRGASLTANHIGAASNGWVTGEARLIHRGKMTHVWDMEIRDESGNKVSVARMTVMIIPK